MKNFLKTIIYSMVAITATLCFSCSKDDDILSFSDIVSSNYTATGIPGFQDESGPTTWTGQVTPSSGDNGLFFYKIDAWGGTGYWVYCDFKDEKLVLDDYTKVVDDQTKPSVGYFCALAINTSTKTYHIIDYDYIIEYNKRTKKMDFSGTYNGFPVYVGIVAKNRDTGEIEGSYSELYASAILTLTPTSQLRSGTIAKSGALSYSAVISPEEFKNYTPDNKSKMRK